MTDITARLQLPYILPSQAQKHVTHNEALRMLDALVQPVVASRTLASPPASPANGDGYIVASGATGDWAGQDNALAVFQDGAWQFFPPAAGWLAYVVDGAERVVFTGTGWKVAADRGGPDLDRFGIKTDADATNRLAIASDASLFSHDGNDHRLTINKAQEADTASAIFQTGHSGRAEFGLTGDDNWHVKVSADGTNWKEAFFVDRATGYFSIGGIPPLVPFQVRGRALFSTNPTTLVDENSGYIVQIQNAAANTSMKFAAGPGNTAYFGLGSTTSALQQNINVYNGTGEMRFVNNGHRVSLNADGSVRLTGIGTTASAANAFLDSGDGNNLLRSTSSLKYKRDIEPVEPARAEALMAVDPIWYRSKAKADNPNWSWYGFAAEDVANVDPRMVHWGFGEDDYEAVETEVPFDKLGPDGEPVLDAAGKPEQVSEKQLEYRLKDDAKPSPQGVSYERFVVHHHIVIKRLLERISALEGNAKRGSARP
ncbi:DUF2793 domain-containing protein [Oricola sp.]|uniref:DUF2793 domain-containing protein n=1 Tax=Oricola sp. TaxID=1979950 RepID=UPI003BAD53B5